MTNAGAERQPKRGRIMHSIPAADHHSRLLIFLLLPIYWLVNMSFRPMPDRLDHDAVAHSRHSQLHADITDESWYSGYINS